MNTDREKPKPSLRQFWFHILQVPSVASNVARYFNYALTAIILVNCAAVALETVPSIYSPRIDLFFMLEAVSTAIFLAEYCGRIWVCVENPKFASPVIGRLRYAFQIIMMLDFLVVVTYFAPVDLRFLRVFRLLRLLRVLHLEDIDKSLTSVLAELARRKNLLIVSIMMMLIAVYCFAAILFSVEHSAQPSKFSSIPETLWWAVVTLTTIGYGDMAPITPLGKLLSAMISMVGIGVFALPTAIITASILDAGADHHKSCPHCGGKL